MLKISSNITMQTQTAPLITKNLQTSSLMITRKAMEIRARPCHKEAQIHLCLTDPKLRHWDLHKTQILMSLSNFSEIRSDQEVSEESSES